MARGASAKLKVIEKIKQAFGQDYIGKINKKVYVYADDDGERVQIAISMTCPKNPVASVNTAELNYNSGIDFTNNDTVIVAPEKTEISESERENVRKLMKRMGL